MLKRVYEDPKMLLHFANNAKQVFNVTYPNLFPPAWRASSTNSFTFYYNGLLEMTLRHLEDTKQRNQPNSSKELLGALNTLNKIVDLEP